MVMISCIKMLAMAFNRCWQSTIDKVNNEPIVPIIVPSRVSPSVFVFVSIRHLPIALLQPYNTTSCTTLSLVDCRSSSAKELEYGTSLLHAPRLDNVIGPPIPTWNERNEHWPPATPPCQTERSNLFGICAAIYAVPVQVVVEHASGEICHQRVHEPQLTNLIFWIGRQ